MFALTVFVVFAFHVCRLRRNDSVVESQLVRRRLAGGDQPNKREGKDLKGLAEWCGVVGEGSNDGGPAGE